VAIRLPDGSIQLADGRIVYANSVILGADLCEIIALCLPPPAWPFVSGGGGGGGAGPQGPAGPAGSGGGGAGTQGQQGFQGTNPGPAGPQGSQGNQGVAGAGVQGPQGNQGSLGVQGNQGFQGLTGAGLQGLQGNQGNQGTLGTQGNQGFQGLTGAGLQGPQGFQGLDGVQGNQGFQGLTGAGLQGPQGFQGLDGAQGSQGFQGFQGLQGPQGFQGNQGNQGFQGSGVQGLQGPQGGGAGVDIFAATRVVSLIAGDGTDLTVAAAIAALPAEGGKIYVKQGTYPLTVTNTLPDKPVDIVGSGDGTIFDLGANVIAAFTIPDGLTAQRNYSFQNFKVIGTSVANQRFLEVSDSNAFGIPTIKSIRTEGIQIPINITDADNNFLTPLFISVYDSWFVPIAAGTSILCNSNGLGNLMDVSFYSSKFIVDDFSTIGGTINGDSFGALDVSFYDCHLSLTGEDGLNTIHAERCRIFNFSGTPEITFLGGLASSDDYLATSAFIDCNVLGMWIIDGAGLTLVGGWWTNNRLETLVINGRSSYTGVIFRAEGSSAATFPVSGGVTAFIGQGDSDLNILGCTFSVTGMTITNYIRGSASMVIQGCAFRGLTVASDAGIRLTGVNNFVVDCDFDTDNWGCPPVREVAPADRNVYNDNLGINGNPNPLIGGAGVDSVFVGVRNTFNGLSQFRATAATTDAFVTITNQIATSGVQGIATIKNTGLNGMNVRETGVDQFGVTSTVTTLVAAGGDLRLDPTNNVGTARPPYTRYSIEVQSSVAGNPTTYVLRLGMNGEVTW
jgi:hypothetical protein